MNIESDPRLDRLAAEYVLGTMQPPTRRRLESVMRHSQAARDAVDAWSNRLHLLSRVEFDLDPSPAVFSRIEQRIDRSARAGASNDASRWSWLRPAFGFALGVLLSVSVMLLQRPTYETLTSPSAPPAAQQRQALRVVFAPGTTVEQMGAALRSVDARIVAGPSELGVITLTIGEGRSLQQALATLRAQPGVTFAEPVQGPKDTK